MSYGILLSFNLGPDITYKKIGERRQGNPSLNVGRKFSKVKLVKELWFNSCSHFKFHDNSVKVTNWVSGNLR